MWFVAQEACDQDQTYFIEHIKKSLYLKYNVFEDVICDACNPCSDMCFYSPVTSIHSIHKIIKIRNSETLSKLEGDTEDTTVQYSIDREIKLRSRKIWIKREKKGIQKKKLSDTQYKSNINTVTEELVSSENISRLAS